MTEELLRDEARLSKAVEENGAGDQHALFNLLGLSNGQLPPAGLWAREFDFGTLLFYGACCDEINQTKSVPVNSASRILHYKGGWRSILLEEGPYTDNRPCRDSLEMHLLWEITYRDYNTRMLKQQMLASVTGAKEKYDFSHEPLERRGIPHSEMLCIIALCDTLGIDIVVESGLACGQSTYMLVQYLDPLRVTVHSIEYVRDDDADYAEKRLLPFSNLQLHYGDSNELMPELLARCRGHKVALLIDGPKGRAAFELLSRCLADSDDIVVAFIHDLRKLDWGKPTEQRYLIHQYFDRLFFTDDQDYVELTRDLDANCAAEPSETGWDTWHPYHKGLQYVESYGPTLAVIMPTDRDRVRAQHRRATPRSAFPRQLAERALRSILGPSAFDQAVRLWRRARALR
jgi:hypothetical protein